MTGPGPGVMVIGRVDVSEGARWDGVTRDEFAMLRDQVTETSRRLDEVDRGGTRGVGAMLVQLADVIRDVTLIQREIADFRGQHTEQHQAEQRSVIATRRWLIGTIIAAFVALEAPIGFLILHVH